MVGAIRVVLVARATRADTDNERRLVRRRARLKTPPGEMRAMDFSPIFDGGHRYQEYLAAFGTPEHQRRWAEVEGCVALTDPQRSLLGGFEREMRVLCVAGAWCGDCVNQCPIFLHFENASSRIQVRYVDRDAPRLLPEPPRLCGGTRVPQVIFLSEEGDFVGHYGDRTLAKYRQMASQQLGPSCPSGLAPPPEDLLVAVVQDWLNEFERIQLLLRTSPRLREKHAD